LIARVGSFPTANAAAWIPWIFWLAQRVLSERRARDVGWLAVALGLQLLAGHAQTAWYGGLMVGAYAVWSAVRLQRGERMARRLRGLALALAGGLIRHPERALLPMQTWLVALLSALVPRLLFESGRWPDLSQKAEAAIILLSLLMALLQRRFAGKLAALALGALWIALGGASLRHGMPLAPPLALKAMLTGGLVLLLPRGRTSRWRQGAILLLLALCGGIGLFPDSFGT
jgi:hypothetical protein